MKIENQNGLTQKDISSITSSRSKGYLLSLAKKIKRQTVFHVGDIVILKTDQGQRKEVSDGVPAKYAIVYIDENDIRYCKLIKTNGKLGALMMMPLHEDYYKFDHDPEIIDNIILDNKDGYDPLLEFKNKQRARKEVTEQNRPFTIADYDKMLYYLSTLKVGDTFWMSQYLNRDFNEYTIVDMQMLHPTVHLEKVRDFLFEVDIRYYWSNNMTPYQEPIFKDTIHRTKFLFTNKPKST